MLDFLTAPATMAWLAGIALPTLVVLYFLKLRRQPLVVPSTLLWKKAIEDLTVNSPFQKLRQNLLLILQLLILLLLLLALAQPRLFAQATAGQRVVLLVDQSASMQAGDAAPTRLAAAKQQAREYLDRLPADTQVMLISFADRASLLAPYTTNHGQVRDLLAAIAPIPGRSRLAEAVNLAEAYTQVGTAQVQDANPVPDNPNLFPTLALFSDGRIEDLAGLMLQRSRLEWLRVGGGEPPAPPAPAPNVGLVGFDARRDYERPERVTAVARVRNFGPRPVQVDATLYRNDRLEQVLSVTLGARVAATTQSAAPMDDTRVLAFKTFDQDAPATLRVELSGLDQPDLLPADNAAWKVLAAPRQVRVLLVTSGNFFLERVLKNLPLRGVDVITPAQWEQGGPPRDPANGERLHDVIVLDRLTVPEAQLPPGNYLFFGGFPAGQAVQLDGTAEGEVLADWDDTHPVLRHVTLSYVYPARWPRLKLAEQARVLVRGETSPVIFSLQRGGSQFLVVAFDLLDSNWPLKPSFPVFCYNAVRLLGQTVGSDDRVLRPGDPLVVPVRPGARPDQEVTLVRPDGTSEKQRVEGRSEVVFGGLSQLGVYAVDGPVLGPPRYAVNLFDDVESDLTPPAELSVRGQEQAVTAQAVGRRAPQELWHWLALAGVIVVLVEWWVYNRRVFV